MTTVTPTTSPESKAASSSRASGLLFSVAEPSDDAELRELLADTEVGQDLTFSIRKEPSFFGAMEAKGRSSQTIICRDKSNDKIVAIISKAVKPVFVNGEETLMGYFSNFRVHKDYRTRNIAFKAMAGILDLRGQTDVPFIVTTVMSGGDKLLNVLNRRKSSSFVMSDLGVYYDSVILVLNGRKKIAPGLKIIRGSEENLDRIVECLRRNGRRRNLYPAYERQDFLEAKGYPKGFTYKGFYAAEAEGRIVGVLGVWDQSAFSQTVITGYSRRMKWFSRLYGLVAPILRLPKLPKPNQKFPHLYLGFIAVDDDKPEILRSLLAAVYRDARKTGPRYLAIALHADDPLREALKGFHTIPCECRLLAMVPKDRPEALAPLKDRTPYLELGSL